MKKHHVMHFLICILVIGLFASPVFSQTYSSKLEYYNNVLVPTRGLKPLPTNELEAYKPGGFLDRKQSVLDVGNIIVLISNGATLGYDRWGKCWEWPANSGFTYRWCMAPLMGGIVNGIKSVASGTRGAARNSEEEFQPVAGYDSGVMDVASNVGIALSDIPAGWPTSWPVGAGEPAIGSKGFPGVGWLPGTEGEVVATREMFFVVTDNDEENGNLPTPLNIRVDIWGLQWDDFINQDFVIFRMNVTNIGASTIEDFYIGMHDDPDTPEQGSQEWTDDFAQFIPPGTDVEGYTDAEDALLENFGYLWDGDDQVEGFIASAVPWVGLKVLETPEDPNNPGNQLGLTTLDVFEYSSAPQTEVAEYEQMEGAFHIMNPDDLNGVMSPNNTEPHATDWTQTPNTFGPDITYVFASGPFQLAPGAENSIPFALASIHAANKQSLFLNAMRCQTLWNASLVASEAPPQPIVRAIPGDKKVSLYWGNQSESGIYADGHVGDKMTGNTDKFQGYKVYKSLDRGTSWGTEITDINGALQGYIPLVQYDLVDGINGESSTRRFFQLGTDSGLKHYYIDQNVSNGYEYWYAVTAYDSDDGAIPPLENSIKTNADYSNVDNTVAVIPQRAATGTTSGSVSMAHTSGTTAVDDFPMTVIDANSLTGHQYEIGFVEKTDGKYFSVKDLSTSSYVIDQVSGEAMDEYPFFDEESDNAPVFDGIRMEVVDISPIEVEEIVGVGAAYGDTVAGWDMYQYGSYDPSGSQWQVNRGHTYEIEFTDETYAAVSLWAIYGYSEPDIEVPFKVTDISVSPAMQLTPIFMDRGSYDLVWTYDEDRLVIQPGMGYPLTSADFSNYDGEVFEFNIYGSEPVTGDKVTIVSTQPLLPSDKYTITTEAVSATQLTANSLKDIQAVPNPFVVSSRFETGAYGYQKVLQFHQLPEVCTLRIYNMAGDFINELQHNGGSVEEWNLQTVNGQEVSFGVYFFHVKAPNIGEHIGKFAIIK